MEAESAFKVDDEDDACDKDDEEDEEEEHADVNGEGEGAPVPIGSNLAHNLQTSKEEVQDTGHVLVPRSPSTAACAVCNRDVGEP